MVTVVSPVLLAAGAAWDDGPVAGAWIAERLGEFGPTVPLGYDEDDGSDERPPVIAALLDVLAPFTGEIAVHSAIWEGWGWLYDTGTRTQAGFEEWYVERPDAAPLELPHRAYYLWTGPLPSSRALTDAPSLIWPEDRSWFVGLPIYTNDIAVAGTDALIDTILADARLAARRATPDDILEDHD